MEKSKKANECRKILNFGERVAKLPRRVPVADPTCLPSSEKEIEKQKNLFFGVKFEQISRILNVGGNYAFDNLLRTHFLRVVKVH